jgi:hypothetical protein
MPFSLRTAQRLMKIASDKRLVRLSKEVTTHGSPILPESYRTLELISRLSDDELEAKVKSGFIHQRMERKDLETIAPREADDIEPADDDEDEREGERENGEDEGGKRGRGRAGKRKGPPPNTEGRFDTVIWCLMQLSDDDCPDAQDIDALGSIEQLRLRQAFAAHLERPSSG